MRAHKMVRMMRIMSNALIPTWTIGDRLRKAREAADIGVQDMAVLIGRGRNSIGNYEAGRRAASVEVVSAYARITNVDLAWLIDGDDPTDPPSTQGVRDSRCTGVRLMTSPRLLELVPAA